MVKLNIQASTEQLVIDWRSLKDVLDPVVLVLELVSFDIAAEFWISLFKSEVESCRSAPWTTVLCHLSQIFELKNV